MSTRVFARILAGYTIPILMMLVIASITFVEIDQMQRASSAVVADALPARSASSDVLIHLLDEETGVRGFVISGRATAGGLDQFLEPYNNGKAALPADLAQMNRFAAGRPALTELMATLAQQIQTVQTFEDSEISLTRAGFDGQQQAALKAGDGKQQFDAIRQTVAAIQKEIVRVVDSLDAQSSTAAAAARIIIAIVFLLAILLTVGVGLWIAGSLSRPLRTLTDAAERIAAGEIADPPKFKRGDEIGVLSSAISRMVASLREFTERERTTREELQNTVDLYIAFVERVANRDLSTTLEVNGNGSLALLGQNLNKMTANLRELAGQTRSATQDLSSTVAEVLATSSQQAAGAAQQAAAVHQTTATINEIRATIEQTSERSAKVAEMSRESVRATEEGHASVTSTVDSMAGIRSQVETIAQNILALSQQSQKIGDMG